MKLCEAGVLFYMRSKKFTLLLAELIGVPEISH